MVSEGSRGPSFRFSQKVEDKLNSEWNCVLIVKFMGKRTQCQKCLQIYV